MPSRILLIDDHQIIRDGLRLLLHEQSDLELAGNAYDSDSGWEAVRELRPDVVLMDLNVPGEGGVALTSRIRAEFPGTRVIVLTGHAEPQFVQSALEAGAAGYVLKGNGFIVLLSAIRAVVSGKTYLCQEASAVVVRQLQRQINRGRDQESALTGRETEVLKQIADGYSTKEIAFELGLSAKTVDTHRMNLMRKLNLKSVAELTKYAIREGLTRV